VARVGMRGDEVWRKRSNGADASHECGLLGYLADFLAMETFESVKEAAETETEITCSHALRAACSFR
jgi:hypothetical protein